MSRALFSQEVIYVNTPSILEIFDPETCLYTTIGPISGSSDILTDIAFTPNGKLYGINSFQIVEIDTATAVATPVCDYPALSLLWFPSLTYLNDSVLLTDGEDSLWAINLYDCSIHSLGKINYTPQYLYTYVSGVVVDSYAVTRSDGDLTWYNGQLYAVSAGTLNRITLNAAATEVVATESVNDTTIQIPYSLGLVTIGDNLDTDGNILAFGGSPYIIALDPYTGVMDSICMPPGEVWAWGATSIYRYHDPVDTGTDPVDSGGVDTIPSLLPDLGKIFEIDLYPNPVADGRLFVHTGNLHLRRAYLYDIYGRRRELSHHIAYTEIVIDLPPAISQGVYIIELITDEGMVRKKITVR